MKIKISNRISTLLWNLFNGFVWVFIIYITEINYVYAPIIVSTLNLITKEINRSLNPYYKW